MSELGSKEARTGTSARKRKQVKQVVDMKQVKQVVNMRRSGKNADDSSQSMTCGQEQAIPESRRRESTPQRQSSQIDGSQQSKSGSRSRKHQSERHSTGCDHA